MYTKIDARAARTKTAIWEAFSSLVRECGIGKITVKEIAERAGINRKTFYLHYETLESFYDDILTQTMNDFFENYETTLDTPKDIEGHAIRFFLFLSTRPLEIEKLICTSGYYDFGPRVYMHQMNRYREAGTNPFGWMAPAQMELVLSFIRNTALSFYRQWVEEGKKVPPEDAAELLALLTNKGVESLMR